MHDGSNVEMSNVERLNVGKEPDAAGPGRMKKRKSRRT